METEMNNKFPYEKAGYGRVLKNDIYYGERVDKIKPCPNCSCELFTTHNRNEEGEIQCANCANWYYPETD